jgi:hypothetical protein
VLLLKRQRVDPLSPRLHTCVHASVVTAVLSSLARIHPPLCVRVCMCAVGIRGVWVARPVGGCQLDVAAAHVGPDGPALRGRFTSRALQRRVAPPFH